MNDGIIAKRLHHTAYVSKDLEKTRKFYEEVLGFPLIATYCEKDVLFGKEREYCHCFFELADGGALAFFQFADPEDQAEFGPDIPESPFNHIALYVDKDGQEELERRIAAAGIQAPDTYTLEHGYCRSIYVKDPNNMILEFTYDAPEAAPLDAERRRTARDELARWLAGDHANNNPFRAKAAEGQA